METIRIWLEWSAPMSGYGEHRRHEVHLVAERPDPTALAGTRTECVFLGVVMEPITWDDAGMPIHHQPVACTPQHWSRSRAGSVRGLPEFSDRIAAVKHLVATAGVGPLLDPDQVRQACGCPATEEVMSPGEAQR